MIAGWVISRLSDLRSKLHFALGLAYTAWYHRKQRAHKAKLTLQVLLVSSPIALAVIVGAACLNAPLLPLLGLPFFLIAFPRPRFHWPASGGKSGDVQSSSLDAAYYKHLAPALVREIQCAILAGDLGAAVGGGEFLLVRRDAFMVLVQVLERGQCFVTLLLKGLELQETSCHHVEAGAVETVMDKILGSAASEMSVGFKPELPWINRHFMHTLAPLTNIKAKTYSIGDVQLTGIRPELTNIKAKAYSVGDVQLTGIVDRPENQEEREVDRPENKEQLPRIFSLALVWQIRAVIRGQHAKWHTDTKLPRPSKHDGFPDDWDVLGALEVSAERNG
ncbi:hypothetical protein T484DRAFT_1766571 [Baffinella frigidus]|nr:hypothetical protein T484DRAFT_1766571 [Cryptophyta sp. CCMP2293]